MLYFDLVLTGYEIILDLMGQHVIKVPDFLSTKLKGSKHNKLVEDVLTSYSDWISRNDTIFFREYTDHGINHLEGILETACLLLTEESKPFFSDSDACILIISTILHDVALHLQESQFIALVNNAKYPGINSDLDNDTWTQLWIKFSAEASRFSQSQLQLLFGVKEPIPIPDLNDFQTWTPLQYQLIGEFLRRHHPRMAHDFALFGFPAKENNKDIFIKIENEEYHKLIDLAGLVARSHGTSLRNLFDYLNKKFSHIRIQEGTHSVYVMVILRIADYLQLQSDRAPKGQFIVKNLRSPLSRREWKIHSAIENIIYDNHIDPESVEVIVDSKKLDIELYLRIQSLFDSIQKELDHSWAVLGEIYGRFKEHKLGITIRRIRSNIDDKTFFGRKAGFVTEKATFTAADAELLKLFIKPLYGDKPEIAVRELIQNSIDAVRERLIFDPNKIELSQSPSIIVAITKYKDKWKLKVEDKGMGMTLYTIIEYFLNAGASYRLSNVWKEDFVDKSGKTKVLRSGRFGVGALAAFMLAEDPTEVEMKVTTRHITSQPEGAFEFTTKLSEKPIQIKHTTKKEPGTIIEITTENPPAFMRESNKKDTNSKWDWYCLDHPIVQRFNLKGKSIPQEVTLPSSLKTSKHDYHWIFPNGYDSVGWSYSQFPNIVCNGIVVIESDLHYSTNKGNESDKKIKMPNLSIFDRDGNLPITLDRLRVEYNELQFLNDLIIDIEKNILAYILIAAPRKKPTSNIYPKLKPHPAFQDSSNHIPWVHVPEGSILYNINLFHILGCDSILEISDSSLIPTIMNSVKNVEEVAYTIDNHSIWDDLKATPNNGSGGNRINIYRPIINKKDINPIIKLIESAGNFEGNKYFINEVENFVENHYKSAITESKLSLIDFVINVLVKEKIVERQLSESFYNILKSYGVSTRQLKTILFIAGTSDYKSEVFLFIEESLNLKLYENYSSSYFSEESRLIDSIENRIRNLTNSKRLSQEMESELNTKFRSNILNSRLNVGSRYRVNFRILEQLLDELKKISQQTPKVEMEKFGRFIETKIDWDEIKSLDFSNFSIECPISELIVNNRFKGKKTDDLLSKIWLTYIGNNIIPYSSTKRKKLINEVKTNFQIERHLAHWQKEFKKR
ncbi:ATP-binding protein [Maribacter sp. 2304DJ31-5]|uniref:HD domain-containing protein n=1 Tax=Maribacter sp. 2304DJ31-5 TaxID=3386273 RepID=UPI0039BD2F68